MADLGKKNPEIILMASGSEVDLIVKAGEELANEGIGVRIVSFPSWGLFEKQDKAYQNSVLNPSITARVSVEAGVSQGWERWVGERGIRISMDQFGTSAPSKELFEKHGFAVENVIKKARMVLKV
jgi:transketolase